mgnify:CR=1 FL=1
MRIGAHVSTSGGLSKGIERAHEIGAEAVQVFASSPRAWAFRPASDEEVARFRKKSMDTGVSPTFIHASYLLNMGGAPDLVEKSVESLTNNMREAARIGAAGVIFHGGSHKGAGFDAVLGQATAALQRVLSESPDDVWLIIENSAGMGAHIGASFQELGRMVEAIGSTQVMICLDTQHTLAAGYNIVDGAGIEEALDEFDKEIGLERLVAVHANDSKMELGSGVDRHENIGEGRIGVKGFQTIMGHPAFRDVPFVLEVPGFDKKGPDKENVDRLKAIRSGLGIA